MILRRRRLWLVVLVGLVLAAGVWAWTLKNSLSVHDLDRIAIGMTRQRVIEILGKQPAAEGTAWDIWFANDGTFSVEYDHDGNVSRLEGANYGFFYWQWLLLNNKLFPPQFVIPSPQPAEGE